MRKAAISGGGSTYTPELITGFLACREKFPLNELRLMDVDKEHMVAAKGAPFNAILSTTSAQ
ncbi:MAG: hypothetical protein ACM33V_03810 [Chloroflexota bacterium]